MLVHVVVLGKLQPHMMVFLMAVWIDLVCIYDEEIFVSYLKLFNSILFMWTAMILATLAHN